MGELSRDWLSRVVAIPADGDPWSRHQRSAALSYLALAVATLHQPIRSAEDPVVRAAEEAVALDGTWDDARAVLGLLYHRLGRDDRAVELVTGAMARPGSGEGSDLCRVVLALSRARAGRIEEARELYEGLGDRPGRDDPRRFDVHVLRCELADLLGRPPPAPWRALPHRQPARRAGAE